MRFAKGAMATVTTSKKRRKWGQICLVTAVLLNGLVLAINLHLTSLQGELQNNRYEEQYFIVNSQTKNDQSARYLQLQENSNQLVLLRRLADSSLTFDERTTVLNNVKELNRESEVSRVNVVVLAYLLAHDPPEDTDLYKMFESKSDDELARLQKQYENQAEKYAINLKKEMIQLMESISFWKYFHNPALVLSSIILIIGSILKFPSELEDTNRQT